MLIIVYILLGIACGSLISSGATLAYSYVAIIALTLIISNGLFSLKKARHLSKNNICIGFCLASILSLIEGLTYYLISSMLLGLPPSIALPVAVALSTPSPAVVLPALQQYASIFRSRGNTLGLAQIQLISSNLIVITTFVLISSSISNPLGYGTLGAFIPLLVAASLVLVGFLLPESLKPGDYIFSIIALAFACPLIFANYGIRYNIGLSTIAYLVIYTCFTKAKAIKLVPLQTKATQFVLPLLFFLMGACFNIPTLISTDHLLYLQILLMLVFGIGLRVLFSWILSLPSLGIYRHPDRSLLCLINLPKATVQASLAPFYLMHSNRISHGSYTADLAYSILILSVLITAGVGSFLLQAFLKSLSNKTNES